MFTALKGLSGNVICPDTVYIFFFFLIILFIFLIQDSLQADLEFKLQSIASYRKTDYKSIWKKNKNKNKRNYRL